MTITELTISLEMGLIYGIVAMGVYFAFRVIDFPDLTGDGSFVLGGVVSALLLKQGFSPFSACCLACIAGGSAGGITGLLSTRLKVHPLLSGILVASMFYSINLRIMGGIPNIALIRQKTLFSMASPLFLLLVVSLLLGFFCSYLLVTDFGLALRSVGQNRECARCCGISPSNMTMIGLVLSNGLIGVGGALFSQHQRFADLSQGMGTVITGLAAVMMGEKLFPVRSPWIAFLGCIAGSILYRIFVAFALHSEWLHLKTQDLNLLTGGMMIALVFFSSRKKGKRAW